MVNIFVVAACTKVHGMVASFVVKIQYSCSSVQPRKPRIFCPTKIIRYTVPYLFDLRRPSKYATLGHFAHNYM